MKVLVTFSSSATSPVVSQYDEVSGPLGAGIIPNEAALVNIISNKIDNDNYTFDSDKNSFRYLRSNTLYTESAADINALVGASDLATPIVSTGDKHSASFAMPNNTGDKLYLIWDYRKSSSLYLNVDTNPYDACCQALPVAPTVACGEVRSYSGGEVFPTTEIITLGTGTGTITLNFNAYGVPDKFQVEFDGVIVINTGYRGDISDQGALNTALAARGVPQESIAGIGRGTATFTKSTATTTAIVRVYAPISGTAWNYSLSCP